MKALGFPDSLREALREKLTEVSCSHRQAAVIFDVRAGSVSNWVNGKSREPVLLNKAKILFFVAGYLDGFMDWLKQEIDTKPEDARTLCRILFSLGARVLWCRKKAHGEKKVAALVREVNALLKKTLAEAH